MATAAKSRIEIAIEALLMKSIQMPPTKATGLTLLEPAFSHLEEESQCQL